MNDTIERRLSDYLTPAEAAKELGVSANRVRQLLREHRIEYLDTPLGRLVHPEALARFKAERETQEGSAAWRR